MSFLQYKASIEELDLVIVYNGPDDMTWLQVDSKKNFNNRFGSFKHKDMIGLEYGTRMKSSDGKGWIQLLHPTPELWTCVLPHRTQILYLSDIALITTMLDIHPGSIVIEAGTGSGSFSHALARTIAPQGMLYTFEYHSLRADMAKKEFEQHGLGDIIKSQQRNVCEVGFGIENVADAIFLDLPSPWDAIAFAKKAFKRNHIGRICTFSPCIEQVQRSCITLKEQGFLDVKTFECLLRYYDVREIVLTALDKTITPMTNEENEQKNEEIEFNEAELVNGIDGLHNTINKKRKITLTKGPQKSYLTAKPSPEMRGHTSYLTFATMVAE